MWGRWWFGSVDRASHLVGTKLFCHELAGAVWIYPWLGGTLCEPLGHVVPPGRLASLMHLLYLDDSGSVGNAADKHVILAGLAVFERQPHWFSQRLDEIAEKVWPAAPKDLEFRGADIFGGKKQWRGVPKDVRFEIYQEVLTVLATSRHVRLFGAVVHKASVSPNESMEYAFEQVSSRFDMFLGRLHRNNDTQRGLIVLDDSSYETSLQSLAREFRTQGHRWGKLHNLSDVPLFVNSKATRMIQFADLIAYV